MFTLELLRSETQAETFSQTSKDIKLSNWNCLPKTTVCSKCAVETFKTRLVTF